MAFGKKKPAKAAGNRHDNEGVDYHQEWVMNADGTRSKTWISCTCAIGHHHDGPIPDPPHQQ